MPIRYLPLVLLCIPGVLGAEPARDREGDPLPEGAIARLQPKDAPARRGRPRSLIYSSDAKRLIFSDGMRLIVWDTATGRAVAEKETTGIYPNTLRVDREGKKILFVTRDRVIHQWQPDTNREQCQTLALPNADDIALSPDGRTAATATLKRKEDLQLYDRKNGTAIQVRTPEAVGLGSLLFSPDSRLLVTVCSDGPLRLWERATGKLAHEWKAGEGKSGYLLHPVFAGDGRSLAFYEAEPTGAAATLLPSPGQLRVYEMRSGRARLSLAVPQGVSALAYSADGRFLACQRGDHRIELYATNTGKRLAVWQGKQGIVKTLAFSRDGRQLASAGATGTILIWKVPQSEDLPATLTTKEADSCWQALRDADAGRSYRALVRLVAAPAQSIPLIKERFPIPQRTREMKRLIADLDSDSFDVRERATQQLGEIGADAVDLLRQALMDNPSLEARRRMRALLERAEEDAALEHLRALRAIEVLERIGSPQAKTLLRELAGKSLRAELREEVQASLRHLGDKP